LLTPLEIHNKEFKRSFRGYEEEAVDEFLDQVIADYEQLYKENIDLRDMISRTEGNMGQYRDLEETLKSALIVAQQTSDKMKNNAEKEAQMVIEEARSRAERLVVEAQTKFERTLYDYERLKNQVLLFRVKLKSFLELQLAMVDEYEEGILNEEKKKSIFPGESKQKLIKEVNQEVAQLDQINHSINEIVDKQDFSIRPNSDSDFQRSLSELAGNDPAKNNQNQNFQRPTGSQNDEVNKINTYDLPRNESNSAQENTIFFSKEEIAAAIDDSTVKDKTIF